MTNTNNPYDANTPGQPGKPGQQFGGPAPHPAQGAPQQPGQPAQPFGAPGQHPAHGAPQQPGQPAQSFDAPGQHPAQGAPQQYGAPGAPLPPGVAPQQHGGPQPYGAQANANPYGATSTGADDAIVKRLPRFGLTLLVIGVLLGAYNIFNSLSLMRVVGFADAFFTVESPIHAIQAYGSIVCVALGIILIIVGFSMRGRSHSN